ncbi:MAG: TM2 domain-containing protein [Ignavibacteriae bacterium]|nr:TM2 domain-containing protein [Ignavibacteriota bacterium]
MYCRNCGNEVSEKAIMCVACGTPPLAGNKYCYNCKTETSPGAVVCMKCGVALGGQTPGFGAIGGTGERKDWLTTLLLALFVGWFGIHRFYTGHTAIGVVQLLTGGGCGIWTLIDIIQIVTGSYKDANGNILVKN